MQLKPRIFSLANIPAPQWAEELQIPALGKEPVVGADRDVVAAAVVAAMDRDITEAGGAQADSVDQVL